jgi:hypothetical protein
MKRAMLSAALLLAPVVAQAGVGASIRSNDSAVYLPMDVRPGLRLEPYFEVARDKENSATLSSTTTSLLLGFGAFAHRPVVDHLVGYAGGRIAFVRDKTSLSGTFSGTTTAEGFRIEPTLGAEYEVTDRVSIAVEEFLGFQNLNGSNPAGDTSSKSFVTGNRLLLRIMLPHPSRPH